LVSSEVETRPRSANRFSTTLEGTTDYARGVSRQARSDRGSARNASRLRSKWQSTRLEMTGEVLEMKNALNWG
jgi:hypothetical protein